MPAKPPGRGQEPERQAADSILKMNGLSKNPEVTKQLVGEAGCDQRVDNFLVRILRGVPKSHVYRILRRGEVRVNGRRVAPDFRLHRGDEVRIPPLRLATAAPVPAVAGVLPALPVLFEDDALLALDKPAGLAVHGGSGIRQGVIERLRAQRPEARFVELVHRLDRDTSGVLLIASKRSALTALHEAMRNGEVEKTYVALVRGRWMEPERRIRLALHKYVTAGGERRVSVRADGKDAVSRVRLMRRWQNFSLVEVGLETGRTHQIRVHLAHLGFPIAGDDKYGDFDLNRKLHKLGLRRMFLHAARLDFRHPLRDERLTIRAALPEALQGFLSRIEANEAQDDAAAL